MGNFIKLTAPPVTNRLSFERYVDIEKITWFEACTTGEGSVVSFCGSENNYVIVQESIHEILRLINQQEK
jgi:hypothetical protein